MLCQRTETMYLDPDPNISRLCHLSKNLYNEANYIVRNNFITDRKWIRYNELYHLVKASENFKALPHNTGQQILKMLDSAWVSFFRAMKAWKKNHEKFQDRPGLPRYKQKNGEHALFFSNAQVKIKNGIVKLPKKVNLPEVKTRLLNTTRLTGARILPLGVGYQLEITYKTEVPEPIITEPKRIAGIDLGVNNLVTVVTNIGRIRPIVVKGGIVKSQNQYFNKRKAELQSVYDHQGIKEGFKQKRLLLKRRFKLHDFFHKTSKAIIQWCHQNSIDTIVIGHNNGWKQNVELGKRTNQNFVFIPFNKLISQLKYKAENYGIKVVEVEESHTSKCSFFDREPVMHLNGYVGKRICRGLFRTSNGILVNADVNAAYNIIRKAIPGAFSAEGIEGLGVAPRRLSV